MSKRRYQVFISSTFADLQEERQAVMQALLKLNCIPSGMELFPSANEEQFSLIKKVIDDCDYFLVILAGRYGSVKEPEGISYTELEYNYAIEKGRYIMGFVHRDPSQLQNYKCEQDPVKIQQLAQFKSKVQNKLCEFWTNKDNLSCHITTSLHYAINEHPQPGWIRGSSVDLQPAIISASKFNADFYSEAHILPFNLSFITSQTVADGVFILRDSQEQKSEIVHLDWWTICELLLPVFLEGASKEYVAEAIIGKLKETMTTRREPKQTLHDFRVDEEGLNRCLALFELSGVIETVGGLRVLTKCSRSWYLKKLTGQ